MSFFKDLGRFISAPIQRALGKDQGDRQTMAPVQQYAYGSQDALDAKNKQFTQNELQGQQDVNAGLVRGNQAADQASGALNTFANQQGAQQSANNAGFYSQMANYGQTRMGQANAAGALMRSGDQANNNFQRTDQMAYNAQQDAAARQALSLGARGGASGIRTALASNAANNVANQNQANITRANETNQILGLQQNAYNSAAGIIGNVGSQDQSAAGMFSNRQQANAANQVSAVNANAGIQQNAANAQTNAGADLRNANLNADVGVNTAQFNGAQNYEQQRQGNAKDNYNNKWKPILSSLKT